MTFLEEFGDWLAFATATVKPFGGDGAWGPTHGAPVEVPAFYDYQDRLVKTSDGNTVTSTTVLFASTEYASALGIGAEVRIPGHPDPFTVLTVRSWPGDDTHLEVNLL